MKWYKIILTDLQVLDEHSGKICDWASHLIFSGISNNNIEIYSDAVRKDMSYGDERILYLKPETYELLKEQLTEYTGEFCSEPDYENLSMLV